MRAEAVNEISPLSSSGPVTSARDLSAFLTNKSDAGPSRGSKDEKCLRAFEIAVEGRKSVG